MRSSHFIYDSISVCAKRRNDKTITISIFTVQEWGTGYAVLWNQLTVQPGLEDGDVLELVWVSLEGVCAQNNEVGA